MSLYVLDTDHLTLLRMGHAKVVARIAATPVSELAMTIISIRVADYLEIGDVLAAKDPGDEVTIKIRRGEKQQTLRLRLAER